MKSSLRSLSPSLPIPNKTQNPAFLLYQTLRLPCQYLPYEAHRGRCPVPLMIAPDGSQLPLLQNRAGPNRSCLPGSFYAPAPLTSFPNLHNLPPLSTCRWAQWRCLIELRYKALPLFLSVGLTAQQLMLQNFLGVKDEGRLHLRPHP